MDALIAGLRNLTVRTKAGQIRALMPVIEERLAAGVAQQDIVSALRESGIDMTLGTFKSYLHRHRAKLREPSSSKRLLNPVPMASEPTRSDTPDPTKQQVDADAASADHISEQIGSSFRFEDVFDREKMDAYADQFMNHRRPLIGRNRNKT